jgi:hypothetical protein
MQVPTRYGLWKANGMRCLYCGHLVQFTELEIDHIIPACTGDAELERLRLTLGLGADFYLGDTRNLAPTHHDCNRKKADTQFHDATLGFYLEIWAKKQDGVRQEALEFKRAAERGETLARLLHLAESHGLSHSTGEVRSGRFSGKTAEYRPEQWEAARIRHAYVMAVFDVPGSPPSIIPVIKRVWQRLQQPRVPPNRSTVLRWRAKYESAGNDIAALIDHHEKKGNRTQRYPREVENFVQQAIECVYLTLERKSIRETLDRAIALVRSENDQRSADTQLPLPTRRLVTRMIEAIPAFDRHAARHGYVYAVMKFRRRLASRTAIATLERTEGDHIRLDHTDGSHSIR